MGGDLELIRDGGTFVRGQLSLGSHVVAIDIAHEPSRLVQPRDVVQEVVVDSLEDLHANKLTCLLSRAEPRDLVDLYFLDRADHPPEASLASALEKDAGIDPAILSYLLQSFPTAPLPQMLKPLSEAELVRFRSDLAERFRQTSLPVPSKK